MEKSHIKCEFLSHFHHNKQFLDSWKFSLQLFELTVVVGLLLKLVIHKGITKPHPVPLLCLGQERPHSKIREL